MRGLDVTRSVHYPKAEDIPVAHAAIRHFGRGATSNSSPLVAPKRTCADPSKFMDSRPANDMADWNPLTRH
jgi:hypothetical protein